MQKRQYRRRNKNRNPYELDERKNRQQNADIVPVLPPGALPINYPGLHIYEQYSRIACSIIECFAILHNQPSTYEQLEVAFRQLNPHLTKHTIPRMYVQQWSTMAERKGVPSIVHNGPSDCMYAETGEYHRVCRCNGHFKSRALVLWIDESIPVFDTPITIPPLPSSYIPEVGGSSLPSSSKPSRTRQRRRTKVGRQQQRQSPGTISSDNGDYSEDLALYEQELESSSQNVTYGFQNGFDNEDLHALLGEWEELHAESEPLPPSPPSASSSLLLSQPELEFPMSYNVGGEKLHFDAGAMYNQQFSDLIADSTTDITESTTENLDWNTADFDSIDALFKGILY